jgi:hypothetical protein
LNLEESRWEEEENTGWLHGEASKPEGEASGGLERREAGGNGGSGAGEAPGGDLGEAAASWEEERVGVNEGNRQVALTPTLFTQGETARAGVFGAGNPECPASRHRSLRGAKPGVSGLPRPDHTAVNLSMFLRKMKWFQMKGIGLGQKEVTEWYLVFMFAKVQIKLK